MAFHFENSLWPFIFQYEGMFDPGWRHYNLSEDEPTEMAAHYCKEHNMAFKRYSRGENVWYSHKKADGKWCREQ